MFHVSSVYLFLSSLLLISGCATIMNGTHQEIGISSNPSGASVMVDNQKSLTTPARVELKRNEAHTFLFRRDGYRDDSFIITSRLSGWVWGNLVMGGVAGAFLGGGIDLVSGGARKLSHNAVHVDMVPLNAVYAPAQRTTATLAPAMLPISEPASVVRQANIPAMYNNAPAADTQMRNAEREFRAGRMSLGEFRSIKKVLQGK